MSNPIKLVILNGIVKIKTLAGNVLSIFGIKDTGARTGTITNNVIDWSLQHITKTTAEWAADTTTVLLIGQLGIDNDGTNTFKLKIGNGTNTWSGLGYVGGGAGSQTLAQTLALGNSSGNNDINMDNNLAPRFINGNNGDSNLYFLQNGTIGLYSINKVELFGDAGVDTADIFYTLETPDRLLILDANKKIITAETTTYPDLTELSYLKGATSSIQQQLNLKIISFPIVFSPAQLNVVADNTTYYATTDYAGSLTTLSANRGTYIYRNCTLKAVGFEYLGSAIATAELSTLFVRRNDTSNDTITATLSLSGQIGFTYITGLNIAYTAGEYIALGLTTATFVTNPSNLRPGVILYFEYT